MKKISLLLFILLPAFLLGQNRKDDAVARIKALKEGALLVRLKSGGLQKTALEQLGDAKALGAYSKKLEEENSSVVNAFRHFTFCPVYFFYSSSSENIRHKNLKGALLNAQLQPDSTLSPSLPVFLTAEFGFSDKQQIEGLLLLDDQFNPLPAPFPYLIRKFESPVKKRSQAEMVEVLDKKLKSLSEE
ncbi:MAG TPA: hypothetical protein VGO45_12610 [Bacteroidia bacterium]|nr:hypothetical protein [Bacteroidia bacterium]